MLFYSTRNKQLRVNLADAVINGLAGDGGLYLPEEFLPFSLQEIKNLKGLSLEALAFLVAERLLRGSLPKDDLEAMVNATLGFSAPLIELDANQYICELFHGPTLAFKDFGARFLAQLMGYLVKQQGKEITVLVATSGDTGGAVAAGFYQTPGVKVVLLYPQGRVSPLQEQQLTSFGQNIHALEVQGSFDDCQALVKTAFQDNALCSKHNLTSANSINIARLIPQSFYYFSSYAQLPDAESISVAVPSGNFGNLTAGIFARKLGLPIKQLIAGTNANDTVPDFLERGKYQAQKSVQTISNAMDVGNPSNLERLRVLYDDDIEKIREQFSAVRISDAETIEIMRSTYHHKSYVLDPHTAVGVGASQKLRAACADCPHVILATAHPIKFSEVVKDALGINPETPDSIKDLFAKAQHKTLISTHFEELKQQIEMIA
jgi:threonine synthase